MIELREVSRLFTVGGQEVRAMDRVSLTIEPGEYLSIMGPSGSGKSTLLNIIGLLDTPDSGSYLLQGRDVTGLSDRELAAVSCRCCWPACPAASGPSAAPACSNPSASPPASTTGRTNSPAVSASGWPSPGR